MKRSGLNIDVTSATEQRKFGALMAGAFVVLGTVHAWHAHAFRPALFVMAALFLAPTLVWPRALQPVLAIWLRFAEALNWLMTRVFLTLAYYLLITPAAFLVRIFSDDPLHRTWRPDALTYWEDAEAQPDDPDAYLNQF